VTPQDDSAQPGLDVGVPTPAPRDVPRSVVFRHLVQVQGRIVGLYWVIVVVAFALIGAAYAFFSRNVELSVWDWATQSPKYFLLAMGTILTAAYLPVFVAHGVTRRTFALMATVWVLLVTVSAGVIMALGYLVEGFVYDAAGWPQALTSPHLYDSAGESVLIFTEFALLTLGHMVTGWLIGTGYYRWGWWWGTAFMVPALLPAVVVELALSTSWIGELIETVFDYSPPPLGFGVMISLCGAAAGLVATFTLVRTTPLRSKV